MGERTLDAIAGIIFVIMILGMEYLKLDLSYAAIFIWVFAIFFHAYIFGRNVFPKRSWMLTLPMGMVLLFAVKSIVQVIWFYAGAELGSLSDAWSLVIAIAAAHMASVSAESDELMDAPAAPPTAEWSSKRQLIAFLLIMAAMGALAFIAVTAWNAQTMESIRTPWPLLSSGVLPAIAILWVTAALSAFTVQKAFVTAAHAIFAILGTLMIAPIVYVLGFGFDGFLHVAGQEVILKTGTLDPKPFYYMGQYVFSTWLCRFLAIPLADINRWLLPVSAAFILPASIAFANDRLDPNYYTVLILALFPLAPFVATTPQGFAIVIGLAAVILAIGTSERHIRMAAPVWLGIWSILIHPLAGIPLFGIMIALLFTRLKNWGAKLAYVFAAGAGFAVPVTFFIASRFTQTLQIEWNIDLIAQWSSWTTAFAGLIPWLGNHYVLWPAWASLMEAIIPALALGLAVLCFVLKYPVKRRVVILIIGAVSLILSSGLMEQAGDFVFLIQYERGDYANRLVQLAVFLLIIAAIPGFTYVANRLKFSVPLATLIFMLCLGSIGAANAHNALPRHDPVEASRGWSTGRSDLETVRWIDRYAKNRPYTVLANQSVSAAAVLEYGFKRYTDDGIFYYPIPTGGSLYQVFLDTVYQIPSRETVKEAARLGESELVFVVINDYWWRANELNEQLSEIADDEWNIDNGKDMIYIFKFEPVKMNAE